MITSAYSGGGKNIINIINAHRKGWVYSDYCILGIKDKKIKYLSNRDYCSLHPLNGKESSWIDDKLTLKYILNGTSLGKYMPEYYFQIDSYKTIKPLTDYPKDSDQPLSIHDIIALLESKRCLAFKKIKASLGVGFFRAEYNPTTTKYALNDKICSRTEIEHHISQLQDYIVMEFLKPHPGFAKYSSKSVGCLRYLLGRRLSGTPIEIKSFMRLGTEKSGAVENYNAGGILTYIKNGVFNGGHIIDTETMTDKIISNHPDTGQPIQGIIPMWDNIKSIALQIFELMPQLNYIGIDFCITQDDKIKLLEINSLTSLDAIQLEESIFETSAGVFFKERLSI